MENAYGIGVANRYALFLDEAEDPLEVLKVQEQEREAKKKTKLSEKENKGKTETKGKASQVPRKGIKETQNVKPVDTGKTKEENNKPKTSVPRPVTERPERNVKFAGESREERNNRRNREDRPFIGAGEFNREGRETTRTEGEIRGRGRGGGLGGGGRGVGRGRGMRGGGRGGYDNRGKREFDRQSGSDKTGVKSVDKRDGAGAHNWGTHRDEIEVQLQSNRLNDDSNDWSEKADEQQQPPEPAEAKETDGGAAVVDENAQPAEEEARELTLDEYYAMRGSRQKPTYNIRKAGEGEDLTQWKKMYELKKKDGEEEDEEEEEYDASEYPQRVGRQKHLLDIDIHFADSRRGTRGRGRGGMRGVGRGRGSSSGGGSGGGGGGSVGGGGGNSSGSGSGSAGGGVGSGTTGGGGAVAGLPRGPGESRFGDRPDREPYQRSQRQQQSAPKVDDEHDFPSLG